MCLRRVCGDKLEVTKQMDGFINNRLDGLVQLFSFGPKRAETSHVNHSQSV